MLKHRKFFIILMAAALLFASCSFFEKSQVVLWTDVPEFALYAEVFNASQSKYKVEIAYYDLIAEKLSSTNEQPDIVVGRWLKSASTRFLFKPLDWLLTDNSLDGTAFYPRLLELGIIEEAQYLLPVSFNVPALVFAQTNSPMLSNGFTVGLEEAKTLGADFNVSQRDSYTRMGFSPDWGNGFLFVSAALLGADFREGDASPLSWNEAALYRALDYNKAWIAEANTSMRAVDDFTFKYFYDPPVKLISQGRILFTFMNSDEIFTLDPEQRANLDFRWLSENDQIPLNEGTVYYGLYQRGTALKGAEAFTEWFFKSENQRLLLETIKHRQLNTMLFGIAGGFSAMRNVTEEVFPRFYPHLLGHVPPDDFLSPNNILPQNWLTVKERVILPFMHEYIRAEDGAELRPLDRRVSDWYRINR